MDKYNRFDEFMLAVMDKARDKNPILFDDKTVYDDMKTVLGCAGVAMVSLLASPSMCGATIYNSVYRSHFSRYYKSETQNLSSHKNVSLAVKNVGMMFKNRFDSHVGEKMYVDALVDDAANELIDQLKKNKNKEI
ncbi:MAG: hypothetical protein II817_01320 [Bacteroidales bacterium]|nr:hypothetical protein [Bacteroidales bacterium]